MEGISGSFGIWEETRAKGVRMGIEEEIQRIEEEIRKTPYNKATEYHIGRLKAKLARLKEEAKKKSSPKISGIKKSGDARVILVGFPSVGKSTLLNKLTNAESKIGEYEFTTLDIIPGMMEYRGAKIQILDVPGLIEKAGEGRGRGKEVLSVVRTADLILILVDARNPEQEEAIKKELYHAGFRLDKKKPDVVIRKRNYGGLDIRIPPRFSLSRETLRAILQEFKILNVEVVIREDIGIDDLVDVLMGNRVYVPSLTVANKTDLISREEVLELERKGVVCISAKEGRNLEKLKEGIWRALGLIRIYPKKIGKKPEETPVILGKDSRIEDLCKKLHGEFVKNFDYAKVWGKSCKFPGQKVGKNHRLLDGDVVEIHLRK